MTTAGATLAAAFAIESLPKHPQLDFAPSPTATEASFVISPAGAGPTLDKNNGKFPTKASKRKTTWMINKKTIQLKQIKNEDNFNIQPKNRTNRIANDQRKQTKGTLAMRGAHAIEQELTVSQLFLEFNPE